VVQDFGSVDPRRVAAFDAFQYYEQSDEPQVWQQRIHAVRLRDETSLDSLEELTVGASAILLDAYHPDKLGGAGITSDWNLAAEAVKRLSKPVILAGGLSPENVAEAIARVRPYAVDVSSGVESEPGRKDPEKVRRFIDAVREFDSSNAG
jgi:phosphoribosylanthranilate isomerase